MTGHEVDEIRVPDDRPPDWANSIMRWAVTTPGIQGWVGRGVALLSFDGRRTGRRYTIPLSYYRDGDTVTVVTKRLRRWWHNFEDPIEVEIRLAGHSYTGKAQVETDEETVLEFMTGYLAERPVDAKAYGLGKDVTRERIARIVPQIVMIRIDMNA